ncbi:hypothetical protein GDO78_008415 [Eleutherodactylus coqui]|uniref:Uncharacterized protein n=1 Tax=Eleutherodactylus coqui TaxID=57060 RepID=A0A8J6FBK7_ELECQ|nr:hypothetical protein GDO78_008415 [Eleutherodactylus coqui]
MTRIVQYPVFTILYCLLVIQSWLFLYFQYFFLKSYSIDSVYYGIINVFIHFSVLFSSLYLNYVIPYSLWFYMHLRSASPASTEEEVRKYSVMCMLSGFCVKWSLLPKQGGLGGGGGCSPLRSLAPMPSCSCTGVKGKGCIIQSHCTQQCSRERLLLF